jgi:predicted Na+-dependent transporter
MELAIKLVGIVVVVAYLIQTGLGIRRGTLRQRLKESKGELVRALLVMLVLGPLAARLLVSVFALDVRPAVALVMLSLVGVVPLASKGARAARADVSFALDITLILAVIAAFTAEPWTRFLLGYRGPLDAKPATHALQGLMLEAVPLAIGMYLGTKKFAPRLEKTLAKFNKIAIAIILVVAWVLLPRYGLVRSLGWKGIVAALVFAGFISAAGYLLCGPDGRARRTVAAIANMPNIVFALPIVTSARVDSGFLVAIGGVFIVRFVTGLVIEQFMARAEARKTKAAAIATLAITAGCNGGSHAPTTSSTHTSSAEVTAAGSPQLRTVDNTGFVDPGGRTRQVSQGVGPAPVGHGADVLPPNREQIAGGAGGVTLTPRAATPAAPRPAPIEVGDLTQRAARALCDRESACGRIGASGTFESADACMANERRRVRDILGSRSCKEIVGDVAVGCLEAIRERNCSAATAIVGAPPECSPETLCPAQ